MSGAEAPPAAISLLYEDEALVVVDKPAGTPVIPAPGHAGCVRDWAAAQVGSRLWVVHRLDLETSGALAFARTAAAHRALCLAFEHRDVQKTYLGFVRGASALEGTIDQALHRARKGKMRPALAGEAGAIDAQTAYAVRRRWQLDGDIVSLVEARPLTGRQHQIRVHLRSLGTPLLHDGVYGGREPDATARLPIHRLALHARSLVVPHPGSGREVRAEAPEPADFRAVRRALDAAWTVVG